MSKMPKMSKSKKMFVLIAALALSVTVILPIVMLELTENGSTKGHHSINNLISNSKELRVNRDNPTSSPTLSPSEKSNAVPTANPNSNPGATFTVEKSLARGFAGLPISQTPALKGAKWGHIKCDEDVDKIAYWNDPQGEQDQNFQSPFATLSDSQSKRRYLTFEPDPGGWNNIRMSMEIIFSLAATTGRTLVLPPKAPFYLLGMGEEYSRSFGSFYDVSKESFQKQVEVISMEEFFEREVYAHPQDQKPLLEFPDGGIQELKTTKHQSFVSIEKGQKITVIISTSP